MKFHVHRLQTSCLLYGYFNVDKKHLLPPCTKISIVPGEVKMPFFACKKEKKPQCRKP